MGYKLIKKEEVFHVSKFGLELDAYGSQGDFNVCHASVEEGHNQEFYHQESTFHYFILKGEATFYLNGESISVEKGDLLSIEPGTRIYYKGAIEFVLITNPPWTEEKEVEVRPNVW